MFNSSRPLHLRSARIGLSETDSLRQVRHFEGGARWDGRLHVVRPTVHNVIDDRALWRARLRPGHTADAEVGPPGMWQNHGARA